MSIGDTVKVGNDWEVTLSSVKTSQGEDYTAPTAGNTYLIFNISMKNLTSQAQAISSIIQYTLSDASGTKYNITIDPDTRSVIDGSVDANSLAKRVIVYEVPTSVKSFTLKFESNAFDTSSPSAEWIIHL